MVAKVCLTYSIRVRMLIFFHKKKEKTESFHGKIFEDLWEQKVPKWHKISSRGKFVRQRQKKTELQNDDLQKMYQLE